MVVNLEPDSGFYSSAFPEAKSGKEMLDSVEACTDMQSPTLGNEQRRPRRAENMSLSRIVDVLSDTNQRPYLRQNDKHVQLAWNGEPKVCTTRAWASHADPCDLGNRGSHPEAGRHV